MTPFRRQADAIESALLAAFDVDQIERLGLRSGTVHAFQGGEAETVVAALGLVEDDSPARTRFVADPHLFNVLVTRAQRRMVVVTSLASGAGVVGDYLAYAASPPVPTDRPVPPGADWTAQLAAELGHAGLPVRRDYPVGHWRVDLCVGAADKAIGLICRTHPDGPQAHIERQHTLHRAGWRLVDAFASRWSADPVRASLDVADALRQ